jgi:hypothetical protein
MDGVIGVVSSPETTSYACFKNPDGNSRAPGSFPSDRPRGSSAAPGVGGQWS